MSYYNVGNKVYQMFPGKDGKMVSTVIAIAVNAGTAKTFAKLMSDRQKKKT